MTDSVIYHNPRCSTSRNTLELLPLVVTPKDTRLAQPIDNVREIL